MKLRFVGDENKEIVVTLVNGRQFIVHTNWRKFHKVMVKFYYSDSNFVIIGCERKKYCIFFVIY